MNRMMKLPTYTQLEARYNDLLTNYLKYRSRNPFNKDIQRLIGKGLNRYFVISKKGKSEHYTLKEESDAVDAVIGETPDIFERNGESFKKLFSEADAFFKSLSSKEYPELSGQELLDLYKVYCDIFTQQGTIVYLLFRCDDSLKPLTDDLRDFLAEKEPDQHDWAATLGLPPHESIFLQQEREFLNIVMNAPSINPLPQGIVKQLERHAERFCWVPIQSDEHPWDVAHFTKELEVKFSKKEDLRLKCSQANSYLSNLKQKQQEILEKIQPTPKIIRIIRTLQNIAHLRELRKVVYSKAKLYSRQLFKEIAVRIGCSEAEVPLLTPEEVEAFFLSQKKADSKAIAGRKEHYVLEGNNGNIQIYTDDLAREKETHILEHSPKVSEGISLIKGMLACKGKAKGRVRILLGKKDAVFEQGDILVTSMTTPDLVPIMEKSAAIITDEGGMLCHAAIVSRELGIPCIVGTKIATKVLKDGDVVEVDATQGIIKKLSGSDV